MALRIALFLLSNTARADSGMRKYQSGRYDEAQKEYQRQMEKTPADPRLRYNLGATAYRRGHFEEAAKAFDDVTKAPDLALQEKAYFNLGDSLVRLGEKAEDPSAKMKHWEESVKQFDSALKLNKQDSDAQHNLDFVKKKLEELKQQQQEQEKKESRKDQPKNEKQDGKDSSQDQKPPPPDKQEKKQSDERKDPQQQPQPQPSKEESPKKEDQKQGGGKDEQEQQPQQQEKQDPAEGGKSESKPAGAGQQAGTKPGEMTMQQAEQLLDSQKGEERALIFLPPQATNRSSRAFKDW